MASSDSSVRIVIEAATGDVSKIEAALKGIGAQVEKTTEQTTKHAQSALEANAKLEVLERSCNAVKIGLLNLSQAFDGVNEKVAAGLRSFVDIADAGGDAVESFSRMQMASSVLDKTLAAIPLGINAIAVATKVVGEMTAELGRLDQQYIATSQNMYMGTIAQEKAQNMINKAIAEGATGLDQYSNISDKAAAAAKFLADKLKEAAAAEPIKQREETLRLMEEERKELEALGEQWVKEAEAKRAASDAIGQGLNPALREMLDAERSNMQMGDEWAQQRADELLYYQESEQALMKKKLAAGEIVSYTELMNAGLVEEAKALEAEQRKVVDVTEAMYGEKEAIDDATEALAVNSDAIDQNVKKLELAIGQTETFTQTAADLNAQIQANAGQARDVGHTEQWWSQQEEKIKGEYEGDEERQKLAELEAKRKEETKLMEELKRRQLTGPGNEENMRRIRELLEQLSGGV